MGGIALPSALGTDPSGSTYGSHSMSYGGGILIGLPMIPAIQIELGLLYMTRGHTQTLSGTTTEYSFTTVQAPLLLRIYPTPAVSLGIGAYFSHGIGSVTTAPATSLTSTATIPYGFGTYGADDYGAAASFSLRMRITSGVAFVLDARYLYSLANVSKYTSSTLFFRDLQILGGIQFGK